MIARAAGAAALALAGCATLSSGDAERGRQVFIEREQGHCVLCHVVPGVPIAGNVGPSLAGVGARLTRDQIRERVTDITRFTPEATMPAYGRSAGLERVAPGYAGRPILSPAQIEDVAAWLASLQ